MATIRITDAVSRSNERDASELNKFHKKQHKVQVQAANVERVKRVVA